MCSVPIISSSAVEVLYLLYLIKVTLSCYVKIDIGSAEHVIGMITD